MAVLGDIANAELLCRTGLPEAVQIKLLSNMLQDLGRILSDRGSLAAAAAEAEQHQRTAGLDSPLSGADMQRLALLLHFRCTRHLSQAMLSQGMAAQHLLQQVGTMNEELLQLEGSGPMCPCFLRRKGINIVERQLHSKGQPLWGQALQPGAAAAAYEAALVACDRNRGKRCVVTSGRISGIDIGSHSIASVALCSVQREPPRLPFHTASCSSHGMPAASMVEYVTAITLARELMAGGQGPRWSLARVRSLLDRAAHALERCKPWLPTRVWQMNKGMVVDIYSKAAAVAAATLPLAIACLPSPMLRWTSHLLHSSSAFLHALSAARRRCSSKRATPVGLRCTGERHLCCRCWHMGWVGRLAYLLHHAMLLPSPHLPQLQGLPDEGLACRAQAGVRCCACSRPWWQACSLTRLPVQAGERDSLGPCVSAVTHGSHSDITFAWDHLVSLC